MGGLMANSSKGLFYKRVTHHAIIGYDYQMALPNLFAPNFDESVDMICGYILRTYKAARKVKRDMHRTLRFGVNSKLSLDAIHSVGSINPQNVKNFTQKFDIDIFLDVDAHCLENGMLFESCKRLKESGFSRVYVNAGMGLMLVPEHVLDLCDGVKLSNTFFLETFKGDRKFLTDCLVYLCKRHKGDIIVDGVNNHQSYAFLSNFPVAMSGSYFF
ncbi:hypothetical protein [Enterovibrio coralii]|uniref:EAL domain-containing protein n=1 Tax=Enterovibrio coralii TaxID=294935 RepID=A0A135I5G9_9GAMM|nr:hypothetical protein [Enterovibrio coralii]KXF80681.1 hypothetical protein ATN88_08585 [Enterovibrio coralii]